jgi:predicted RNase H-like nuclease (RuvC/YqgF family)
MTEEENEALRARIAEQEARIETLEQEINKLSATKGLRKKANDWRILFLQVIKWDLILVEVFKWALRGLISLVIGLSGFALVWVQQVWQTVSTIGKTLGK